MTLNESKEWHRRASEVLVGGVNSPVRSFKRVGGQPVLASHGDGPFLWDVDGNRYIDLVMSYGPHLYGHRHPMILDAIGNSLSQSTALGFSTKNEVLWAEAMLRRFPKGHKVRAMSTGTEACATAVRLARGVTGRDKILKCAGHYHGHVDSLLVDSGSGLATLSSQPVADSKGLPSTLVNLSRVVEFNDDLALRRVFEQEGSEIAGFILEPIMGNMGVIPPSASYLKLAREMCTKYGALLIFDEVMTGFRVASNSAQGLFGVVPDLSTFGKVVGGGLPVSALVGRAEIMDALAPLGGVYQAGTLSGHGTGIAAGMGMLRLLEQDPPYETLEQVSLKIHGAFEEAAKCLEKPIRVQRVGSMISFFCRKDSVQNAADARDVDEAFYRRLFWSLLEEGVLLPPSPFEACFLSVAHAQVVDELEERITRAFKKTQ
jgi:glutamate-1-semialdehyde 2,1-aminomutase